MSVATVAGSNLLGGKARRLKDLPWQRPKDWPALPTVSVGESKFVALVGVYELDNFTTFQATVTGGYTVDWGDGSAPENFASNAIAKHNYSFSASGLGPVTSEGFKTAIVTVMPTGASAWTGFDITAQHTIGLSRYVPPWLDVRVGGPSLSGLTIALGANTNPNIGIRQFEFVGTHSIPATAMGAQFQNMASLESVIFPKSFTAGKTTLDSFFAGCSALEFVSPMDTSACTDFGSMFSTCSCLPSVPDLDTSQGTIFSAMFRNCSMLKTVPPLNTSKATTMATMFQNCPFLESIPPLDTHLVTTVNGMLSGCSSLRSVPLMDTSKVTDFTSMLAACVSLTTVPPFNCAASNGWAAMFSGCTALQVVPAMDWSKGSSGAGLAFATCTSLSKVLITGLRFSVTFPSRLSAVELNRIYTNLGIASGAQTITVSGNPGIAGDDPTIATAKGWTVTGS